VSIPSAVLAGAGFLIAAATGPWISENWETPTLVAVVVLAVAGILRPHFLFPLVAALLLGALRVPQPRDTPLDPPRPLSLEGEVDSWNRGEDPGGWGWLTNIRVGNEGECRELDAEESILFTSSQKGPEPGIRIAIRGRLEWRGGRVRLENAVWSPLPGEGSPSFLPALRHAIRQRLESRLPPREAGLAKALLLGERSGVAANRRRDFRELGLLHLLAVSGLHFWVWDGLLRILLPLRLRFLRIPLLLLAGILAGGRPPVVRALTALILRDLFASRGFSIPGIRLWAGAMFAEIALLPCREAGLGFVLSYSATAALILAGPSPGLGSWAGTLRMSAAAWMGTAGILHAFQGTLEPWSIPLTPPLAWLLPFRLLGAGIALTPLPVSGFLLGLGGLEDLLLGATQGLPGRPWVIPQSASLGVGIAGWAGIALLHTGNRMPKFPRLLCWALLPLLLLPGPARPGIAALSLGHGLGMVVAGTHSTILFDLGSGEDSPAGIVDRRLLPLLAMEGWAFPGRVILSHRDLDHRNGLPALSRRGSWREIQVLEGQRFFLDGLDPFQVEVLGCRRPAAEGANSQGRVLDVRGPHGFRAILLGDTGGWALRELISRMDPGPVALLVLPHHGLTTDGLGELLDHFLPKRSWVSCGRGDLPLPAAALLRSRGIPLASTLEGNLLMAP